jgi:hypothetical protein
MNECEECELPQPYGSDSQLFSVCQHREGSNVRTRRRWAFENAGGQAGMTVVAPPTGPTREATR